MFVTNEIASQPSCWERAIELSAVASGLPSPGERVAVIGCGTSLYIAQAYAALRESAGLGETDAFAASEFPYRREYDRVVAICRSGTTTEVLKLLRATSLPTLAVTGDPTTPIMESADAAGRSGLRRRDVRRPDALRDHRTDPAPSPSGAHRAFAAARRSGRPGHGGGERAVAFRCRRPYAVHVPRRRVDQWDRA